MATDIRLNDKNALKALRDQIDNVLNGSIDGLEFHAGSATYSPDGSFVTFKLEAKIKGAESKEMYDLRSIADIYGIDLDKKHPLYTLVGYNSKARKSPFLIEVKGKTGTYKCTTEQAKSYFGAASKDGVSLVEALAE
jgi:hypothetical protein